MGFASSLLAGAWSGWLGGGFQVAAWGIVVSSLALLGAAAAGFINQVCRELRAAGLSRSRSARFGLLGLAIVTAGIGLWTMQHRLAPGENLLGNHDQGMYLGAAIHLAKTGRFRVALPEFDRFPPESKNLLLRREPVQFTRGSEEGRAAFLGISPGLTLADQTTPAGPAVPHFPAGVATFFGAGFAIGGWSWMQGMNWGATLLGILSLGWLAARRLGAVVGLAVVLLLVLHPLTAWAANRHYAEPLLFALWTTGLCLLGSAARGRFVAGLAAGLIFSAALSVKFDALVIVAATPAALLFARMNRAALRGLVLGGLVGAAAAGVLISQQSGAYLLGNIRSLASDPAVVAGVVAAAIALAVAGWLRVRLGLVAATDRSSESRLPPVWTRESRQSKPPEGGTPNSRLRNLRRAWWTLVAGATLAALWLYLFRADPSSPDTYFHAGLGREIRSFREETLRRLDWYWMPLGFLPALAGACVLSRRQHAPEIAAMAVAGFGTLVVFGCDLFCNPVQPYAMRRLFVYTLPFLVVGLAFLLRLRRPIAWSTVPRTRRCVHGLRWRDRLCPVRGRHGGRPSSHAYLFIATCMVIGGQAAGETFAQRTLGNVPEHAGTWDFCNRLIAHIPPDAVVLVSDRSAFSALAMAIRFAGGREVWIVRFDKGKTANMAPLSDLVAQWMKEGKRVMLLGGEGIEARLPAHTPTIVARERWQTRWQPGSPDRLNMPVRKLDAVCHIRELLPARDP